MSATSPFFTDDVATRPNLPAEALDGIADFLAGVSDPGGRAALVSALVLEICDTAAWMVDAPGSRELDSMRRIVAEAQAHHARMTGSDARTATSGAFVHHVAAAAAVPA